MEKGGGRKKGRKMNKAMALLLSAGMWTAVSLSPSHAQTNLTTVCHFTVGPRAGSTFDFASFGARPIPVGSACTDGNLSSGVAVPAVSPPTPVPGFQPGANMTTVCQFNSGPRAGTAFDFAPFGVPAHSGGESLHGRTAKVTVLQLQSWPRRRPLILQLRRQLRRPVGRMGGRATPLATARILSNTRSCPRLQPSRQSCGAGLPQLKRYLASIDTRFRRRRSLKRLTATLQLPLGGRMQC